MEAHQDSAARPPELLALFEARLAEARTTHPDLFIPPGLERMVQALRQAADGQPLPNDLQLPHSDLRRLLLLQLERAKAASPAPTVPPGATAMDYLGVTWVICLGLGLVSGSLITYFLWLGAGNRLFTFSAASQVMAGGFVGLVLGGVAGFPIAGLVGLLVRMARR